MSLNGHLSIKKDSLHLFFGKAFLLYHYYGHTFAQDPCPMDHGICNFCRPFHDHRFYKLSLSDLIQYDHALPHGPLSTVLQFTIFLDSSLVIISTGSWCDYLKNKTCFLTKRLQCLDWWPLSFLRVTHINFLFHLKLGTKQFCDLFVYQWALQNRS